MLEAYRQHVEERAKEGLPPLALNAEQVADLIELIKNPPAGEEEYIVDLLVNRVPPGVDPKRLCPGHSPPIPSTEPGDTGHHRGGAGHPPPAQL